MRDTPLFVIISLDIVRMTLSSSSAAHPPAATVRTRPRSLTGEVEQTMSDRIRDGRWAAGIKLPREADLIAEFQVSRTVVREAISRLQAAGMVETRHGIGTFVVGLSESSGFRVRAEQMATLHDVIDVLELRIAIETEAASLAASRRTDDHIKAMRSALDRFAAALQAHRDAVGADFQFHLEIARATQNARFVELMTTLGNSMIPRARLETSTPVAAEREAYLQRVALEHDVIFKAIERRDAEAARAAMRTHLTHSRERRQQALR
jgi:DNA-binding FadR family transcriptional regulator